MNFKKSNKLFECFKIGLIFSCPSSCRPTLVTDLLTYSLFCHCVGFKAFQPSRPNRNLAKLMGVMKKHGLTNKNTMTKTMQRQRQWQWQLHLENTFKEQSLIFLTFETFDQSDEKAWPTNKRTATKTKTNTMTNTFRELSDPWNFRP